MNATDPFQAALWRCSDCSALSYAGDAAWLDERTVLIEFEPGCEHIDPETWVIDVVDLRAQQCGHVCVATTADGRPCRGRPKRGARFCHAHRSYDIAQGA